MNRNSRSKATYDIVSTGKSGILSEWSSTPRSNGRRRLSNRNTCWTCSSWSRTRKSECGPAPTSPTIRSRRRRVRSRPDRPPAIPPPRKGIEHHEQSQPDRFGEQHVVLGRPVVVLGHDHLG